MTAARRLSYAVGPGSDSSSDSDSAGGRAGARTLGWGLSFRSESGDVLARRLRARGDVVESDAVSESGSESDPDSESDSGFKIPRARLDSRADGNTVPSVDPGT